MKKYTRHLTIIAIILTAAGSRLLPHPWNFTPITALALFGGAQLIDKRLGLNLPFTALILSDLFLGFHLLSPFIYGSFGITLCFGIWLRNRITPSRLVIASILGSTQFFLITNFSVWALLNTYPKNISGLVECYIAGLPFYRNGLLGDILYTTILFSGFQIAERTCPSLRSVEWKKKSA